MRWKTLAEHTDYSKQLATLQREKANAALANGNWLSVVSIVLGALLLGGLSLALKRSISRGCPAWTHVARVESGTRPDDARRTAS